MIMDDRMKIKVNGKELEVSGKRLLIDELREAGCDIPSLCFVPGVEHQPSCMVCMVRDVAVDRMIPSCGTYPAEGMVIDTDSDHVKTLRRTAIELLLSDHHARCGECEGRTVCRLRELSLLMAAKWTRYGPLAPVKTGGRTLVNGRMWFEPARCIRCGLCVYNSKNGFTFQGRGYDMEVVIAEENKGNVDETLVDLCPTGALFVV